MFRRVIGRLTKPPLPRSSDSARLATGAAGGANLLGKVSDKPGIQTLSGSTDPAALTPGPNDPTTRN